MRSSFIVFVALFTFSFSALAGRIHDLARAGRWDEVRGMVERGEARLEDLDDDGRTTVWHIAKERGVSLGINTPRLNPALAAPRAQPVNHQGYRPVGDLNALPEADRVHVALICAAFGCDPSAISIKGSLGPRSH